jgi:hypothetical protein
VEFSNTIATSFKLASYSLQTLKSMNASIRPKIFVKLEISSQSNYKPADAASIALGMDSIVQRGIIVCC